MAAAPWSHLASLVERLALWPLLDFARSRALRPAHSEKGLHTVIVHLDVDEQPKDPRTESKCKHHIKFERCRTGRGDGALAR